MYIVYTADAGRRSWLKSWSRKDNEVYFEGGRGSSLKKNKIITGFEKWW